MSGWIKKLGGIVAALALLSGCGSDVTRNSGFAMGTYVEVTSPDPRASQIVFDEFARLEKIFSLYDKTSELSLLNQKGDLVVSADLFDVLERSAALTQRSLGAFDVTVAPLALLWKKAIKNGRLPAKEEVEAARSLVGFDKVYLDPETRRVKLLHEGVRIDLGGVAKGYAVDKAVRRLREAGVPSAIVNAGGDLYCLGRHRGKPWRVGVQGARPPETLVLRLDLADQAAATSGDYEQFFIFENKRYSHIINPKTGYPADSGVASATVVAPDAFTADGLATALVVLGGEAGRPMLAELPGVRVRLIDDLGKVHEL